MNKRGQVFFIATIIIVAAVFGITTINNYAFVKSEKSSFYDLSKQIEFETKQVIDYGVYNSTDTGVLIRSFVSNYKNYVGRDQVIFVYGNGTSLNATYFRDQDIGSVGISTGAGSATVPINDIVGRPATVGSGQNQGGGQNAVVMIESVNYSFNLRPGQNFFFVILKQESNETYVATTSDYEVENRQPELPSGTRQINIEYLGLINDTSFVPNNVLQPNNWFGYSVAAIDSQHVAVGAPLRLQGSIFSFQLTPNYQIPNFAEVRDRNLPGSGSSLVAKDLDNNGISDFIVGSATYAVSKGAIALEFLNFQGQIVNSKIITDGQGGFGNLDLSDSFGSAVSIDSASNILVGAPGDDGPVCSTCNTGAVHLIKIDTQGRIVGSTHVIDSGAIALDNNDQFGASVASISPGLMAVGAPGDDDGCQTTDCNKGAIYLVSYDPQTHGSVNIVGKINSSSLSPFVTAPEDGGLLGSSVASIGDVDGDGVNDIAIGAKSSPSPTQGSGGKVYVVLLNQAYGVKGVGLIDSNAIAALNPLIHKGDWFGASVAPLAPASNSESTLLIGSPFRDSLRGAVYVIKVGYR